MTRWIIGVVCVLFAIVCLRFGLRLTHVRTRSEQLKPLGLPEEKGWGDVRLPVTSVQCSTAGCVIDAFGLDEGRRSGLRIRTAFFGPDTAPKRNDGLPEIRFKDAGVILEPQGDATVNLLRRLSTLYEHPAQTFDLPKNIPLISATLQGDPDRIEDQVVKFKVFHGGDEAEDPKYFEL